MRAMGLCHAGFGHELLSSGVARCKEVDGIIPGTSGLDIPGAPLNASAKAPLLTLTSRLLRASRISYAKLNLIASIECDFKVRAVECE